MGIREELITKYYYATALDAKKISEAVAAKIMQYAQHCCTKETITCLHKNIDSDAYEFLYFDKAHEQLVCNMVIKANDLYFKILEHLLIKEMLN